MRNITINTETRTAHGFEQPANPYKFAKAVQFAQELSKDYGFQPVLFNKGTYFEATITNNNILKEVSELINLPIKYSNMIVGSWDKLEDFVIAMNCFNIYVVIDIDYI
jgi:hypothetical protein